MSWGVEQGVLSEQGIDDACVPVGNHRGLALARRAAAWAKSQGTAGDESGRRRRSVGQQCQLPGRRWSRRGTSAVQMMSDVIGGQYSAEGDHGQVIKMTAGQIWGKEP